MIAENLPEGKTIEDLPMVDIGRPSFFTNKTADAWKVFHEWIATGPVPTHVSEAFYLVRDMLQEGQKYGGNGYKYCFWFNSEEDKKKFVGRYRELEKLLDSLPVYP